MNLLAERLAERYRKSLAQLRPCKPGEEMLEQNLITFLCHEFLAMYDEGVAYSEIPFISDLQVNSWSNRLDAYLANEHAAYVVEAKSTKRKSDLIKDITKDLQRIYSEELKRSFQIMTERSDVNHQLPEAVYGLIVADFWSLSTDKAWFTSEEFEQAFSRKLSAKVIKVGCYGRYDYYVVLAQTRKLAW